MLAIRSPKNPRHALYYSLLLHGIVLLFFIVTVEYSGKIYVTENNPEAKDVMEAVVLSAATPSPQPMKSVEQKVATHPNPAQPATKSDTIILPQKKPITDRKQLLADLSQDVKKPQPAASKAKQKKLEKELQEARAAALQQQMQQEQSRLAAVARQQMQGEVDKYKALILQVISQNWLVPATVNKKLAAELLIRLAPGGLVLDVQVIKSSGDLSLDRSARAAVFKASPLPVPQDSAAFEPFRQFVLKVKPENVLVNG